LAIDKYGFLTKFDCINYAIEYANKHNKSTYWASRAAYWHVTIKIWETGAWKSFMYLSSKDIGSFFDNTWKLIGTRMLIQRKGIQCIKS